MNGRLAKKSSRQVTLEDEWTQQLGASRRDYEFVLEIGDGRREIVRFTSDGPDDPLRARRGDDILVVYSMRRKDVEELLYISNLTSGDVLTVTLPEAGANRSGRALRYFVAFVFVGMAAVIGYAHPVGVGIAAVVAYLAWRWSQRRLSERAD